MAEVSLAEKIRSIIQDHPEYGAFKIKRELNSEKYGFAKASWFNIRNELAQLGLNNKSKRFEFALKSK